MKRASVIPVLTSTATTLVNKPYDALKLPGAILARRTHFPSTFLGSQRSGEICGCAERHHSGKSL
jgi:hypothetical protein